MTRLTTILLLFTLGPAAAAEPAPSFQPADAKALAIRIVSEPTGYDLPISIAGTELTARARCSTQLPRAIDVTLRWDVKQPEAKGIRIDLTEFRDGFAKGRYLTSGERPGTEQTIAFADARPGLYYYWRVLLDTGDGWVVRGTGRFDAPICPADRESENE